VAVSPNIAKKLIGSGFKITVQEDAGIEMNCFNSCRFFSTLIQ